MIEKYKRTLVDGVECSVKTDISTGSLASIFTARAELAGQNSQKYAGQLERLNLSGLVWSVQFNSLASTDITYGMPPCAMRNSVTWLLCRLSRLIESRNTVVVPQFMSHVTSP